MKINQLEALELLKNSESVYIHFVKEALLSPYDEKLKKIVSEIFKNLADSKPFLKIIENGGLIAQLRKNQDKKWMDAMYEINPKIFRSEKAFIDSLHNGPTNGFKYFLKEFTFDKIQEWLKLGKTDSLYVGSDDLLYYIDGVDRWHEFEKIAGKNIELPFLLSNFENSSIDIRTDLNKYRKSKPYLESLITRIEEHLFKNVNVQKLLLDTPEDEKDFYFGMAINRLEKCGEKAFDSNSINTEEAKVLDMFFDMQVNVYNYILSTSLKTKKSEKLLELVEKNMNFKPRTIDEDYGLQNVVRIFNQMIKLNFLNDFLVRKLFEQNPFILPSNVLKCFPNKEMKAKVENAILQSSSLHLQDSEVSKRLTSTL